MNKDQLEKIREGNGFVAALDQSGGSTPKALALYGISESEYSSVEEMFDLIHAMRSRIITSSVFTGDKIVGAILFEMTMDREVEGTPTPTYLWEKKQVVPFLKVDKGLEDEANGAQIMKPMPGLDELLSRAKEKGVFGTKMRSVIKFANPQGIKKVVDQQFEIAKQILDHGLVPIIEPEVDINSPEKAQAEELLKAEIFAHLESLGDDQIMMLKLTLPDTPNFYKELSDHPKVLKIVALSGGYSREVANQKLSQNHGIIASFSRALTEGLSAQQTDDQFNQTLAKTIDEIYQASIT